MKDHTMILTSVFVAAVLFLFLPEFLDRSLNDRPQRYDHATAQVEIVKPINDVAAVALIRHMTPHKMPTIAGDAEITRGSEIYIKAPDSLRAQLRIDPTSRHVVRCIQISPADYGWKVRNVFTSYKCQNRHYD